VPLDLLRWDYFAEIGYDPAHAQALRDHDLHALADYWKPFEVHAVERMFADYPTGLYEFGASYTVQDDPDLWARIRAAFAPLDHVVLLLPDPDPDEALRVTIARLEAEAAAYGDVMRSELVDLNRHFIESPCNAQLASVTIYTGDKTPEGVADAALAALAA
jgi:hypothetical protein